MTTAALRSRVASAVDRVFDGTVSPWTYAALRVALGTVFLVRHSDWLRGWVSLEHHRWVHGLEFLEQAPVRPFLSSPLVPGLSLVGAANHALVHVRTVLAFLFLVGVRPKLAALLLAVVSYALLVSDRYHYLHHLHLLYLSVAWASLAPLGDRLSLERAVRRGLASLRDHATSERFEAPHSSPFWPLACLRALTVGVYAASGSAKLNGAWLRGETLRDLHQIGVVGGPVWALVEHFGAAAAARSVALIELLLPILLLSPRTRRVAMALGVSLHALISATMGVSTFGIEMAVLLATFWQTGVSRTDARPAGAAPVRT